MMERATARPLPDGRLHLSHGPMDLIVSAEGPDGAAATAFAAAGRRFATMLQELVAELGELRRPDGRVTGTTASRMSAAVTPHRPHRFVTPMAAVAGAVADEILAAMTTAAPLSRAIVNNGGDIALHLAPDAVATARIARHDGSTAGTIRLGAGDGIGGIATSGRHGRSFSLGIADSVTVLAATSAAADAAATLIANAIDLPGHPAVARVPAETLAPDTDLAGCLVTTHVGPLAPVEVAAALHSGRTEAESMRKAGLVRAAALFLGGQSLTVAAESLTLMENRAT